MKIRSKCIICTVRLPSLFCELMKVWNWYSKKVCVFSNPHAADLNQRVWIGFTLFASKWQCKMEQKIATLLFSWKMPVTNIAPAKGWFPNYYGQQSALYMVLWPWVVTRDGPQGTTCTHLWNNSLGWPQQPWPPQMKGHQGLEILPWKCSGKCAHACRPRNTGERWVLK